jgi:SPP1 gp7 family putative phage head morphogenesis protein
LRGLAGLTQEALEYELSELYHQCHDTCQHEHHVNDLADSGDDVEEMLTQMVLNIWKEKGMPKTIDGNVAGYYASQLMKGIEKGYGESLMSVDFDSPDFGMLKHLKEDVFHFSAAKNYTQLRQLSQALLNDKGQLRTFSEFKEAAHGINQDHVDRWLKAEYEQAVASSQMAATWTKVKDDEKELPLLKFDAINDNRTSPVCKELDGVTRPVNDTFWQIYYPPNHWGCRSDVQQLAHGQITPTERIITPDNMPAIFKTNLAEKGLAFPPSHPYYIGNPNQVKEQATELMSKPTANTFTKVKSIEEAQAWAKANLKANIANMKGVNIDLANDLLAGLHDLETKMPHIEPINVSFTGMSNGRAYMQYDWNNKTLHIRKSYKEIEKRLAGDNLTWFKQYKDRFSVSDNVRDLINHEFGHHIDNVTKRALYKEIQSLELDIRNKAFSISGYASSDRFINDSVQGSEMIAEQIAARLKDDAMFKKQPKEIQNIINKIFVP